MPEIAIEDEGNVIFYGFMADYQTKFAITRRVEGQITFRLLHPVLTRLQTSTTKMIKKNHAIKIGRFEFNNRKPKCGNL